MSRSASQSLTEAVRELLQFGIDVQPPLQQETSSPYPSPRKKIVEYRIEGDLGSGAYSIVKRARHREAHDDAPCVALKMLIKSRLRPELIFHDFDTGLSLPVELYVLRHLREHPHPNIISMIDTWEDSLYYYIVMPLNGPSGIDLFEAIERSRDFLPPERVARIISQIIMAVAHLHLALGVAHRDIKDENIIIDERIDHTQLIDFGSAAYFRAQEEAPLTEAEIRCGKRQADYDVYYGTQEYAAPEVVRGERYIGPPQDIWALGVLLYVLAFKEVPFPTPQSVLEHRLRIPFEPSPDIVRMVQWLLEPDIAKRPTAEQLIADPWVIQSYTQPFRDCSS